MSPDRTPAPPAPEGPVPLGTGPTAAALGADLTPEVEEAVDRLVVELAPEANADLVRDILRTGARLGRDDVERLDLKITRADGGRDA